MMRVEVLGYVEGVVDYRNVGIYALDGLAVLGVHVHGDRPHLQHPLPADLPEECSSCRSLFPSSRNRISPVSQSSTTVAYRCPLCRENSSTQDVSAGMGGQHVPVPVPQQGLVHLPDQLPVGEQRTGKALDRHVRASEQTLDLEVEAGGDEMPALLERNVLPCCLVAFGAEQLLVANIQDNLPISYYQVLQGDPQMLVACSLPPQCWQESGILVVTMECIVWTMTVPIGLVPRWLLACHLVIWQM